MAELVTQVVVQAIELGVAASLPPGLNRASQELLRRRTDGLNPERALDELNRVINRRIQTRLVQEQPGPDEKRGARAGTLVNEQGGQGIILKEEVELEDDDEGVS